MRRTVAFGFILGLSMAGISGAQAMTSVGGPAIDAQTSVIQVAGGCGPYGHRGPGGYCRPNRPPPPRYSRCPPGTHPTPYGCRRNF